MKTEKRTIVTKKLQVIEEAVNASQQKIANAEREIKENGNTQALQRLVHKERETIKHLESAFPFAIGMWVHRNTNKMPKPGQIRDIRVVNGFPFIDVRFWNEDKITSLSPKLLKITSEIQLAYEWFEFKLVRRLDKAECRDVEILKARLTESKKTLTTAKLVGQPELALKNYQKEIAYCKNRIEILTGKSASSTNESASTLTASQLNLLERLGNNASDDYKKLIDLNIGQIEAHPDCQQREGLDESVVADYTEILIEGGKLPSIKVKFDGQKYWLYDGFHSLAAHRHARTRLVGSPDKRELSARIKEISVEVTRGELRDAILASCGVNANHGLRRSRQTKRNAVMTLLNDPEWSIWSDREIARRCKVSNRFVSNMRKNLTVNVDSDNSKNSNNLTVNVHSDNPKNSNNLTGNVKRDNLKKSDLALQVKNEKTKNLPTTEDNTTRTSQASGETPEDVSLRKYINKHGQESTMNVKNIGKQNVIPFPDHNELKPNQLLQLNLSNFEGVSEQLRVKNNRYCFITSKAEVANVYNVKFFGEPAVSSSFVVKAEDLKIVERASLTINFEASHFLGLLANYGSPDEMLKVIHKVFGTNNESRKI